MRRVVAVLDAHPTGPELEPHLSEPELADPPPAPRLAGTPTPGAARLAFDRIREADPRRRARMLAGVAGLLIGGANVLLMLALHAGSVAVVAVLVNLYPVATVLLAWIVLRERINAVQGTGVVLAVAASVMLGLA